MLFGLFSPKSPLAIRENAWTEVRMRWLAGQFGLDRLLRAEVVLPDEQWFPKSYEGTPEDARRFLDRIARFMQINPSSVQLEIHEDEVMPGAAGQYQPGLIRLELPWIAPPRIPYPPPRPALFPPGRIPRPPPAARLHQVHQAV